MKLPIKKKYFEQIKSGEKKFEYRDAHITFVCEETKETLRMEVTQAQVKSRHGRYSDVCEDNHVIEFKLYQDLQQRREKATKE